MTDNAAVAIQSQLAELGRRYREQLPVKLGEIISAWDGLQAEWDQELAETLHRTAHSMAGACGTMGMPEVGNGARVVERSIKQLLEDPTRFASLSREIAAAIAALGATIKHGDAASAAVSEHPALPALPPLKILVADDDGMGRAVLATLLHADGHSVLTAEDGERAVALFDQHEPDLVLMDVIMPRMNGYEAARIIKEHCGKRFVPLIFLTALQDEKDLVACIEAGGDDFMVKPYNRTLLRAKLIAMHRIHELHQELARHQQKTDEEIALSKHVFETATNRNVKTQAVSHWHAAVGHFSGDLVLYARTPRGRLCVLHGDFTGHGLAAALGALPVSDFFYAMVEDDASLADLIVGVNRKLKTTLPMGHFCAACALVIEADGASIEVWNGGLPALWVLDDASRIEARVDSDKMPLGILDDGSFDAGTRRVPVTPGARLLLFSDGLSEATDAAGEMLGEEGIARHILGAKERDLVPRLRELVQTHLAGAEAHDDMSITLVDLARLGE